MLRKFILILLVVCMISTSFIYVGATSVDAGDIDRSLPFDALSCLSNVSSNSATSTVYLPSFMQINYVDCIFYCRDFLSINFGYNGQRRYDLTVVSLGSNLYRAYGNVSLSSSNFTLFIDHSDTFYWTFYRLDIYSYPTVTRQIEGGCNIVSSGFSGTPIVYRPSDPTNRRNWIGLNSDAYGDTALELYPTGVSWKGFDFIEFFLRISLHDITSISCTFNEVSLPFDISYIENSFVGSNEFLVKIRIDIRDIDKRLDVLPRVFIFGHESFIKENVVDILEITGINFFNSRYSVEFFLNNISNSVRTGFNSIADYFTNLASTISNLFSNLISSLSSWFSTLFSDLNDIKNALTGSVEDGEQIQDNIDNSKQEMDDYKNAMDSLPVPDIGDVDLDLDDNSGNAAITSVGRVLAIGINNEVTLPIFMLLFTFAMVGYALYGKR